MKLPQSRIVFALAGLGLLWLAGMILFGRNGYLDYLDLEDRLARIESENQAVAEENARLRRLVSRLKNDPDYIEHVARKELGMVGKDELIYRYKPEGKQTDER
ncbi:MAG: FtsB family cell division protein [Desulfosudaceae bacterium]